MKEIKIHVVCRGNVYRSRLVEACIKSLNKRHILVTSSGIEAEKHYADERYISPLTIEIVQQHALINYLSVVRQQTTNELLEAADIIIFVSPDVYRDAGLMYQFNQDKSVVWSINDVTNINTALANKKRLNKTFRLILHQVNKLFDEDLRGSWVDIVDENNQSRGFALPISLANQKGLWHRGCHAVISLPNRSVIVEKRSSNIVFAPSLLDITMGGLIDEGETPGVAMLREIKEELGLVADMEQLEPLCVKKWASYHPHYKKYSRTFIYTYHLTLADEQPSFTVQSSEVAAVKILSPRKLKQLIRRHRIRNLGRLNYGYAYYSEILKLAELLQQV